MPDLPIPDTEPAAPATAPEPESAAPAAAEPAPPAIAELSPAACGARLAELFPALFAQPAQPLKLRIQADIQQRAPGIFTKRTLSAFLHRHTTGNAYLGALARAPQRVDLDGQPAGEIAAEHRQAAVDELARRRGLHEERRAADNAARRQAQQQAQAEAQRAGAADEQARRDRFALLRAFETSTLTRANFCALKGLAETELDAVLAAARSEAAQRAAAPRPDPRPDHRGPRQPGRQGEPRGDRPQEGRRAGPREGRPGGPRPGR